MRKNIIIVNRARPMGRIRPMRRMSIRRRPVVHIVGQRRRGPAFRLNTPLDYIILFFSIIIIITIVIIVGVTSDGNVEVWDLDGVSGGGDMSGSGGGFGYGDGLGDGLGLGG